MSNEQKSLQGFREIPMREFKFYSMAGCWIKHTKFKVPAAGHTPIKAIKIFMELYFPDCQYEYDLLNTIDPDTARRESFYEKNIFMMEHKLVGTTIKAAIEFFEITRK